MKQRITIKDVAADAGVSISVVSYVLNGAEKPVISEATRNRVMDSVRRLGYVPNRAAVTLRKKESKTIGIISFWDYCYAYDGFLKGITRTAKENGYLTLIHQSDAEADEMDYIRLYLEHMVDGLVLILPYIRNRRDPADVLRALMENNVPFSAIGDPVEGMNDHIIHIDYAASVYAACRYFSEKGYRRITYLTPDWNMPDIQERIRGYHRAAAELGFTEDLCPMNELRERIRTFEAVVVYKSDGARELYRAAREQSLDIPGAFEVIAGNTEVFSEHLIPSLSTVCMPGEEIGEAAMEMLVCQMKDQPYKKHPIDACPLMLRETTRQENN